MSRRRRKALLVVAWALASPPLALAADMPAKLRRIGYVAFNAAETTRPLFIAFRETLHELGWVDGQNLVIETRFASGEADRLPALVGELLALDVDLIVAGSSAATRACKAATATVPIVMLASADAVGEGFVASLARPGGNITGMTFLAGPEVAGKQLELLRTIAPTAERVAFLMNRRNGSHVAYASELEVAARRLGVKLQSVQAASRAQLDDAFAAMSKARAAALLVLTDAMFLGERWRITDLARSAALPAMYSQREFADVGGLASYGPSLVDMARGAARHVDRILRGARPQDLPVEQPTKFEFVINLKTAQDLGLTISQAVLARADDLIQRAGTR